MSLSETEVAAQLVNRIASFVEAVGHPMRLRIVAWAYGHPDEKVSAVRLAEALDERVSTMSYHVRTLRDCGLLRPAGEKRVRGAVERFYVLTARGRDLIASVQTFLRDAE